jgi:hypothetical protein
MVFACCGLRRVVIVTSLPLSAMPQLGSWRVDHGVRRMGQRSDARPAVQGAIPADIAPNFGRWHREIPLLRHDPGHRPGLRQEAPARLWRKRCSTLLRRRQTDYVRSTALRASRITAAWAEQKAVREIMVFPHSHGVTRVRKVNFGLDIDQLVENRPQLCSALDQKVR